MLISRKSKKYESSTRMNNMNRSSKSKTHIPKSILKKISTIQIQIFKNLIYKNNKTQYG